MVFAKHRKDPINGFLQHPGDFFNFTEKPTRSYTNNRMSLDLGFDLDNFEASKKSKLEISAFIEQIEKQFDTVLISDYFNESLILLKRCLRWSMKDILYIKRNAAKFGKNSVWHRTPMTRPLINKTFKNWDLVDYELYEHFKPIFLDKVKEEPLFQDELSTYTALMRKVYDYCLKNPAADI